MIASNSNSYTMMILLLFIMYELLMGTWIW
jgi:hypothetical protein